MELNESYRSGPPSETTDGISGQTDEARLMEQILYEVKKVIVGQDHLLERVLVAVLCQGHLLVEGVPGLAKTLTIKTLAQTIQGTFKRVQFTPDLVPADLVGNAHLQPEDGGFLHRAWARVRQPPPGG